MRVAGDNGAYYRRPEERIIWRSSIKGFRGISLSLDDNGPHFGEICQEWPMLHNCGFTIRSVDTSYVLRLVVAERRNTILHFTQMLRPYALGLVIAEQRRPHGEKAESVGEIHSLSANWRC